MIISPLYQQYAAERLILQLFGLRRSGNHAVLDWVTARIDGRVLHLNDITCAHPYQCFRRARATGFSRFELYRRMFTIRGSRGINRYLPEHLLGRRRSSESLSPEELNPDMAHVQKDALLLSYEDWQLDHPKMPRVMRPVDRGLERGTDAYRILLLRDPFNLFASLRRSNRMGQRNSDYYVRIWKQYAREFLGVTSFLGERLIPLSYTDWRDSGQARVELCRRLGIPEAEDAYTHVSQTGGGSSFDGLAENAASMNTGERWKEFVSDPGFVDLFDEELRELSAQIFGPAPF